MSEPARDMRKEWKQFLAEEKLIAESHKQLIEYFRQLGRDAARRKEEAVFAALMEESR